MFTVFRRELSQLVRLASPLLAAQIFTTGMGVVDTVMSGNYHADDLAAVAVGNSIWLPIYLFLCGLMIASTSMVARYHGARQPQQIVETVQQSLWLAMLVAALAMVLLCNVEPLLRLMQAEERLISISSDYLAAVAVGAPGAALFASLRAFSEGMGRTYPFMFASLLAFLLNIPLNYALIYGRWGMPEMGGAGCGWATAFSLWVQALVVLAYTSKPARYDLVRWYTGLRWPQPARIWAIARLGVPIALAVFAEVSIFSVIALMLVPLGTLAVASHQIALSTSYLIFMLPLSLAQALTIRVGYFLGQQRQSHANAVAVTGVVASILLALISMSLLLLFRHTVVDWYTTDPEVHLLAAGLFVWMACYQLPDHIQVSCNAILRGYQDTRVPLGLVLICYWLIALPLGYGAGVAGWFGEPMAAAGFWLALLVGLTGSCLLLGGRLLWLSRQPLRPHA